MTIQDLGSIGELVAGIATIATLLYLAIQIRHNSEVVRTSNFWQLASQFAAFGQQLSQDSELVDIYQRGIVDYLALSEVEQGRFHHLLSGLFLKYQLMAQLESRGFIDADMHQETIGPLADLFKLPGIQQWWATSGHWFGSTFRADVEKHFISPAATGDPQKSPV